MTADIRGRIDARLADLAARNALMAHPPKFHRGEHIGGYSDDCDSCGDDHEAYMVERESER